MLPEKYRQIEEMVKPYVPKRNAEDFDGSMEAFRPNHHKGIIEALPQWLFLFERLSRSTGKVAHVERSKTIQESVKVLHVKEGGDYYTLSLTRLGKQLAFALCNFGPAFIDKAIEAPTDNTPELRWSPRLHLLFESAKEREFTELMAMSDSIRRVHLTRIGDALNGYADQVREQANSARFREKQKAFVRTAHDNYHWLTSLIDECFVGHERLLFACMDLGYTADAGANSESFYPQFKEDGKNLRKCLDSDPFTQGRVLGYGLSLRYIPVKGYHFRLLIVCAPKDNGRSDWLADSVKKIWIQPAEHARQTIDYLGFKLADIKREEKSHRNSINEQVYFLTQLDSLVRLKLAPKDPVFSRGLVKK